MILLNMFRQTNEYNLGAEFNPRVRQEKVKNIFACFLFVALEPLRSTSNVTIPSFPTLISRWQPDFFSFDLKKNTRKSFEIFK